MSWSRLWRGDRRIRRTGRRRLRWLVGGFVVVLVATLAGLAVASPSFAATSCPRCYGLVRVHDDLYAETGLSTAQRQQLVDVFADANRRVSDFYDGRSGSPRVLACFTTGCYQRIGGGNERGKAVRDRAVMLSPRGIDAVIASHELSHVEFHRRLGSLRGQIPQWFDEGLAVVVSDDPRYLLPDTAADRCRVHSDEALPVTLKEWLASASADDDMYAKAACRVSQWLGARDGHQAVADLVDRLDHGESFGSLLDG